MRYRPLGQTGMEVSEIGFGCASWWGRAQFPETDAVRLVHRAIDLGVTLFDTGASYGLGEAEARLGRALAGRSAPDLVVATKAGTFAHDGRVHRDMSAEAVVASAERSLRNLGLERLPILQLHGPSAEEIARLLPTLQGLKSRGMVRAVGVNSFDPAVIEAAVGTPEIDLVMVDYNVLRPERIALVARAAAAGKGVLAGMALAMGHTGGQVARIGSLRGIWYAARALRHHRGDVARGARMTFLHAQRGITGAQAALAWVLADAGVSAAVVGTTRLPHLGENLAASGLSLAPELASQIAAEQARFR